MSSSRPAVKSRILVVFDCMTLQAARKRVEDNILTVLNGFSMGEVVINPSVCGHASASGRHTSGLCIEYSFPIDTPPVGPRLDEVSAHTPAPACTPRCFGPRNHTPSMQSPAVSRSRHLTVCGGVSVCGHASVSGRHASGLCIEYSFPIDAPPVGPRLDEVSAHTPAPACTPRCCG